MNYWIENEILKVEISSRGGELQSIQKDGKEYLWQADPTYWNEKAPNLFPYIARLTQGKYTLNGQEYHLPIHGFLSSCEMIREEQSSDRIVFRLDADEKTLTCYPFDFTFRVIYELEDDELCVTYQVENHSEETMYFGIGGHPGFAVPVGGGDRCSSGEADGNGCCNGAADRSLDFSDFYLEFSQIPGREAVGKEGIPTRIAFSPTCFLTGKDTPYRLENGNRISLRHDLFDNDAIVLQGAPRCVTLKSDKSDRYVRISYPDMEYIGFWHAVQTDAPYVCVEPWSSLPSRQDVVEDLAAQPGLVSLPAGRKYRNQWSIEIH